MKPQTEAAKEMLEKVTAALTDEIHQQISDRMAAGVPDCAMVLLSATRNGITAIPVSREEMYRVPGEDT